MTAKRYGLSDEQRLRLPRRRNDMASINDDSSKGYGSISIKMIRPDFAQYCNDLLFDPR